MSVCTSWLVANERAEAGSFSIEISDESSSIDSLSLIARALHSSLSLSLHIRHSHHHLFIELRHSGAPFIQLNHGHVKGGASTYTEAPDWDVVVGSSLPLLLHIAEANVCV